MVRPIPSASIPPNPSRGAAGAVIVPSAGPKTAFWADFAVIVPFIGPMTALQSPGGGSRAIQEFDGIGIRDAYHARDLLWVGAEPIADLPQTLGLLVRMQVSKMLFAEQRSV